MRCCSCKRDLPEADYYPSDFRIGRGSCKACKRVYKRERRRSMNPDAQRRTSRYQRSEAVATLAAALGYRSSAAGSVSLTDS